MRRAAIYLAHSRDVSLEMLPKLLMGTRATIRRIWLRAKIVLLG